MDWGGGLVGWLGHWSWLGFGNVCFFKCFFGFSLGELGLGLVGFASRERFLFCSEGVRLF